ncbi:MAG: hypothetical protein OCD76_23185, partial [Reichenbachiella sp.]
EGESNVFSSFPKSMGDFNKDYKRSDGVNIDKNSYYLFLLPGSGDGRSGFMPFKRQFGYIWTGNTGSNAAQTIAHELGHGAFRLRHTFSTSGSAFVAGEGTTDNLMDYSDGDALYKHQWDFVHDPESMNGWAQDDTESAYSMYSVEMVAFTLLSDHAKAAKLLREHLSALDVFSYVHALVEQSDGTSDVIVRMDYNDTESTEFVIETFDSETDFFEVLVINYGVDHYDYHSEFSEDWVDMVYYDLLSHEKKFERGETYSSTYVELGSRISAGVAFTLYGWWTDEDLLTGNDLEWWEHALGVLDVVEVGVVAKAALGLKVIKIGGTTIKIAEYSLGVRKLLSHSFSSGVTFVIEEGALVLLKGGIEVGRIVDDALVATKIIPEGTRISETINGYYLAQKSGVIGFVADVGSDLSSFISKSLSDKIKYIDDIWNTKYPIEDMLGGRSFFEDVMGQYRYTKSSGWSHTGDISFNVKGIDFYKGAENVGIIDATTAVSMKTTIQTNVETWLRYPAIQDNIKFLREGLSSKGMIDPNNSLRMFIENAEIHVYMKKANITPSLNEQWLNKLNTDYPDVKFEIKAIEDFVN